MTAEGNRVRVAAHVGVCDVEVEPFVIVLSREERDRLDAIVRQQTAQQRVVVRARIVLAAADGWENVTIADWLHIAVNTVSAWRKRFFDQRCDGLFDRHRSGRPRSFSPSGPGRDETARL